MATEWVEGCGCPSGPVNQQLTAEFCSATIALVTPNAQSFNIQSSCFFFSLAAVIALSSPLCLSLALPHSAHILT